ncbi:MAG TPA: hypothetical protein VER09_06430 [Pseudomonas sp.]|nr:hypothetical protein [Pseudomonas sp.]
MSSPPRSSPWRIPLVRELAVVLLLKLALLLAIKAIWFDTPSEPADAEARVGAHLLGSAQPTSLPSNEESPR